MNYGDIIPQMLKTVYLQNIYNSIFSYTKGIPKKAVDLAALWYPQQEFAARGGFLPFVPGTPRNAFISARRNIAPLAVCELRLGRVRSNEIP